MTVAIGGTYSPNAPTDYITSNSLSYTSVKFSFDLIIYWLLLFNLIKSDALSDEISDIYGGSNLTSGRPWRIWVSCNFVLSSKLHFRYVHIFISLNFNWVNLVDYEGNSDTIKCHPSALAEWFSSTLRYLEPSALEIMIYMDGVLLCYPDAFQSYKHLI